MSMPTGRFASRRLLAGIAAVFAASAFAAAFAALATPALAEEPTLPGADLSVNVPGPKISLKTAAKTVRVDITNVGPDTASDARVTIQVADVSDAVEVVLPGNANCTESPGTVSCPLGDLPARAHEYSLPVTVLPADDAKAGAVAKLTVTVSSGIDDPDPANNTQTVQLELVDEVVDLLAFADALGNDPDVECQVVDHRSGAICHIGRLPANAAAPAAALNVTLAKNAPGPMALTGGSVAGVATEVNPVLAALAAQHPDNNGPSVRAPRGFTDKDSKPGDDTFEFTVFTTANPADLAITAGTASGHVGDIVTVSGTVENHGPADSPSITVIITAPTGTEIVDAPHCDPVAPGRIVKCEAPLAAGDGFAEEVKFKITSSTVGCSSPRPCAAGWFCFFMRRRPPRSRRKACGKVARRGNPSRFKPGGEPSSAAPRRSARVVPRDPRSPGQAAARGRRDVRRRGFAVRPDEHDLVPGAGPALAARHPAGPGPAPWRAGAGPRRRYRRVDGGARPIGCHRHRGRHLARHAGGRPPGPARRRAGRR